MLSEFINQFVSFIAFAIELLPDRLKSLAVLFSISLVTTASSRTICVGFAAASSYPTIA